MEEVALAELARQLLAAGSACSAVSTPSAVTFIARPAASDTMARMISALPASCMPLTNERSILMRLERKPLQIAQRRIAHPEVVQAELDAEVAQVVQDRSRRASEFSSTTPSVISSLRRVGRQARLRQGRASRRRSRSGCMH